MTETNDIVIRDLAKRFQDKIVLADFNAVFAHQAVSCVMGPSGCGKTTLLNLIMGFEKPDQGTITGVPVRISAVFQEDRLLEGFSAVRNVAFAAPRMPRERIVEILSALGLGQDLNKPVREYSGGMKRRVAIARAVAAEGGLVLLDEPFKGLDETTRAQVAAYLRAQLAGRTVILVTHEEEEVRLMGGTLLKMKPGGNDHED
jgi:NitT/TauT family transport system ATP-binding protein